VTGEVLHLRDFEPQRRVYGPPDAPVAVIILPVVRVERAIAAMRQDGDGLQRAVRRSLLDAAT
jgi:hypothetical protein